MMQCVIRLMFALLGTMLFAACSGEQVADRYRAERELFSVESGYLKFKRSDNAHDLSRLHNYAVDFEASAMHISSWSATASTATREVEARAWLRAAECHFALLDSGRAELIVATLAANHADIPSVVGPVAWRQGRIAESQARYRAAILQYRVVAENVTPDPGPEPDEVFDPEAIPEEETVDDFVLNLPLRSTRIAALDTSFVDRGPLYEEAERYYKSFEDDASEFVRVEATRLLAATRADQGHWAEASLTLDSLEGTIPRYVYPATHPRQIRLASFRYQVRARDWGQCSDDSLRTLLDQLIRDYPRGSSAPAALLSIARSEARRGEVELALADLHRIRRDWPTSGVLPNAELLRGRLLERAGKRDDARRALQAIPLSFPTSKAALIAPLELASHYQTSGDRTGAMRALLRAEDHYRELLTRYPEGEHSMETHEKLVQTLTLMGRDSEAVDELLAMCDGEVPLAARPALLMDAARRAEDRLGQPARASEILDRLAEQFPNTRIGRQAVRKANRLREVDTQD